MAPVVGQRERERGGGGGAPAGEESQQPRKQQQRKQRRSSGKKSPSPAGGGNGGGGGGGNDDLSVVSETSLSYGAAEFVPASQRTMPSVGSLQAVVYKQEGGGVQVSGNDPLASSAHQTL